MLCICVGSEDSLPKNITELAWDGCLHLRIPSTTWPRILQDTKKNYDCNIYSEIALKLVLNALTTGGFSAKGKVK